MTALLPPPQPAAVFDGRTSIVRISHHPGLALGPDLTLEAWIRVREFGDWDGVITKGTSACPYSLQLWGDGSLRFTANWGPPAGAVGGGSWNSHGKLAVQRWTHVAVTYSAARRELRFYIDGKLDSTVPDLALVFGANNEDLTLGADLPGGDEYLDGALRDVRLWNRARTDAELAADLHRPLRGSEPGLVAYYRLDEGQGAAATDRGPSRHHGAMQAITWLSEQAYVTLDGQTSIARIPHHPGLALTDALTLEAWVNVTTFGDWDGVITKGINASPYSLQLWGDGSLRFTANWGALAGASGGGSWNSQAKLAARRWTHVAVTYSRAARELRFYIDGQLDSVVAGLDLVFGTCPEDLTLGADLPGGDEYFHGSLCEVRVWNRPRGPSELADAMTRPVAGDEPGLVAYYPLTEPAGDLAVDAGPARVDGLLTAIARARQLVQSATVLPPDVADLALNGLDLELPFMQLHAPLVVRALLGESALPDGTHLYTIDAELREPIAFTATMTLGSRPTTLGREWFLKIPLPFSARQFLVAAMDKLGLGGPARQLVEWTFGVLLDFYSEPVLCVSQAAWFDQQIGAIARGAALHGRVRLSQIQPLGALDSLFPALHLGSTFVGARLLTVPFGARETSLELRLVQNMPLGGGVTLDQLAVYEVVKTGVTLGIRVRFSVAAMDTTLIVAGGLAVDPGTSAVTLTGSLDAPEGWRPLPGIVVKGLGLEVTVIPAPPYLKALKARGAAHVRIGDTDLLDVQVAFATDAAGGVSLIELASHDGIDLRKLLATIAPSSPTWLLDGLSLSLRDFFYYRCAQPTVVANKQYQAGFGMGGTIDLWGWGARVSGAQVKQGEFISTGYLRGDFDPIRLTAGGAPVFALTSADGTRGPRIAIEYNVEKQGVWLTGKLDVLGGLCVLASEVRLEAGGFSYAIDHSAGDLYGGATIALRDGTFSTTLRCGFGCSVSGVGLTVSAEIAVAAGTTHFSQDVAFGFDLFGAQRIVVPCAIPLRSVADVVRLFEQEVLPELADFFTGTLWRATDLAWTWTRDHITANVGDAARLFTQAGADVGDVAQGLTLHMGQTPQSAMTLLKGLGALDIDRAAAVLRGVYLWDIGATADFLKDGLHYPESALESALHFAGFAADEIDDFLEDLWDTLNPFD